MNAMISSQCKISLATPFLARKKKDMKREHCTVKGPTLVTAGHFIEFPKALEC